MIHSNGPVQVRFGGVPLGPFASDEPVVVESDLRIATLADLTKRAARIVAKAEEEALSKFIEEHVVHCPLVSLSEVLEREVHPDFNIYYLKHDRAKFIKILSPDFEFLEGDLHITVPVETHEES